MEFRNNFILLCMCLIPIIIAFLSINTSFTNSCWLQFLFLQYYGIKLPTLCNKTYTVYKSWSFEMSYQNWRLLKSLCFRKYKILWGQIQHLPNYSLETNLKEYIFGLFEYQKLLCWWPTTFTIPAVSLKLAIANLIRYLKLKPSFNKAFYIPAATSFNGCACGYISGISSGIFVIPLENLLLHCYQEVLCGSFLDSMMVWYFASWNIEKIINFILILSIKNMFNIWLWGYSYWKKIL